MFGRVGLEIQHPPVSKAEEVRRAVALLCSGILDTLKAYANGSPSKAYAELCKALEPPGRQLLQSPARLISTIYRDEKHVYYRLRQSGQPLTNPQSLFHLPFELRWRSRGYRFSIAGYPSLYAASSALLCLRELGLDN